MEPTARPSTFLTIPMILMLVFAAVGGFFVGRSESMFDRSAETGADGERTPEESGATPQPDVLPKDPLDPPATPRTAPGMANRMGDRYWYLPYAVTNEEQGLAFVEAYERALESEGPPPDPLKVPEGKGAGGRDELYRVHAGVSDLFIEDINEPEESAVASSDIPLLIAQPLPGANGSNVLYLDGHVEFVPWGEFPITKPFIDALSELDPPERA